MTKGIHHRRMKRWIVAATLAVPTIALAAPPPAAAAKREVPETRNEQLGAAKGALIRSVLDSLSTNKEHEGSPFEPPGKPPDRPPDNPGHNGPPNPPGKPPDRPPDTPGNGPKT
jgi:hypothetical protein